MSELLSCEALTKCYQKDKTALENVDLHIGFGRIVGLLGPNGSGKTTLIKLANGLLQPSAGSIRIAGMTPGPDTKAIVSYLPDAAANQIVGHEQAHFLADLAVIAHWLPAV